MNHSPEIKQIAAALVKAQLVIRAAIKDSTNPHYRSKYADLTSVIEAVKGPLLGNGIAFLQPVGFSETGVSVETILLHTSGEWIAGTLNVPVSKQDAQGVGSAISYGRRYGLQAMCGVPAEDDDGNAASTTVEAPGGSITPSSGVKTRVPPARRKVIEDTAILVKDALREERDFDAFGLCEDFTDADEKVYLWTFLDSKERSRLKTQSKVANGVTS